MSQHRRFLQIVQIRHGRKMKVVVRDRRRVGKEWKAKEWKGLLILLLLQEMGYYHDFKEGGV